MKCGVRKQGRLLDPGKEKALGRKGFQLWQETGPVRAVGEEGKVFFLPCYFEWEGRGLGCPVQPLHSELSNQAHLLLVGNVFNLHTSFSTFLWGIDFMISSILAPFCSFNFQCEKVETMGVIFLILLSWYTINLWFNPDNKAYVFYQHH